MNKSAGGVNFYYEGDVVESADLTIYNASGNIVNKITVRGVVDQAKQQVGSWDLRDSRGRRVGEGTYLVRGIITKADGKREMVSVILGVR